jgi:DNA-binding NtrC family response regulator/tetratricopeptide (TPR) repeat protein
MEIRELEHSIIGSTPAIAALREQIRRLAAFDSVRSPHVPTVLLLGATGTGKGLVARSIHDYGPRAAGPFVDVNCAAIPDNMLEAELFGYESGAFTDAKRAKPGLFEVAGGGTLFLDEIDSLTVSLQSKLLKAIEEKSIRRLGSVASHSVDTKMVAATQRDLAQMVADGQFRADLYHRLAVVVLQLPTLRERIGDIQNLAEHYLQRYASAHGVASKKLTGDARAWLEEHEWPGNVRELSHLMERATLLVPADEIGATTLQELCVPLPTPTGAPADTAPARPAREPAKQSTNGGEESEIRNALRSAGGNVAGAARILGIGRNAMRYRMRRYSIERPALEEIATPPAPTGDAPSQDAAVAPQPETPELPRWEEKIAATLAIELVIPHSDQNTTPGDPWTLLDRWTRRIEERLRGFGGVLLRSSPSRLTAVFGVPRALEQTPQRALHSALAIQRLVAQAVAEREPRPDLRITAHLGSVHVDAGSSDPAANLIPIGETFALPDRLLGHADAGEILLSAQVARRVRDVSELQERQVRIGSETVRVYAIKPGQSGADHPAPYRKSGRTRFVGREHERSFLRDAFDRAAAGNGQAVFVVGDAGIGKSRLLQEFHASLGGDDVLWVEGRCAAYGTANAFLPIIDGLRHYFGIEDRDDEGTAGTKIDRIVRELGEDLAWAVPFVRQLLAMSTDSEVEALDSASRRSEIFRALKAILVREAENRPVVLAVEDLHWIDPASEEFLTFLADALPTIRVLLLCSYRPGYKQPFGDRSYHSRLNLSALSGSETGDVAEAVLGVDTLPADVRALISRKAEGNPFFIEEITASLLEDGTLQRADGKVELTRDMSELDVPDTIQDVLIARIDRLAEQSRNAIQVASVIGREFALRLLERITEAGEGLQSQVEELRTLELIYEKAMHPELAYMFKHALTHDVAYNSIQYERRKHLHQIIGDAVEQLYRDRLAEHYETLAHHYDQGENWEQAFKYHELAAQKAAESHANRSVVHHTRSALRVGIHLGMRFSDEREGDLEERLATALFYLSEYPDSGRAFERAAARAAAAEKRSFLFASAALSFFWAHDYDRAGRATRSALDLARRAEKKGAEANALCLTGLAAAIVGGDIEHYRRVCGQAQLLERESGSELAEAMGCFARTELHEWTGEYREAVEAAERGIALGRKLRLSHFVIWPMWFGGKALCCLGEYDRAIARLNEAFEICDRIGDRAWRSRLLNTLGWCYAEIGAHEIALQHNRRAAIIGAEFGDLEIIANSEVNLALNSMALGELDRAAERLSPIVEAVEQPGDPWMRWRFSLHAWDALARLELARGEPERSMALVEKEIAGAASKSAAKIEARARTLRGEVLLALDRREEAGSALREGFRIAERISYPRAQWHSLSLQAEAHRRDGSSARADELSARARKLAEQTASNLMNNELRRALLQSALDSTPTTK